MGKPSGKAEPFSPEAFDMLGNGRTHAFTVADYSPIRAHPVMFYSLLIPGTQLHLSITVRIKMMTTRLYYIG